MTTAKNKVFIELLLELKLLFSRGDELLVGENKNLVRRKSTEGETFFWWGMSKLSVGGGTPPVGKTLLSLT